MLPPLPPPPDTIYANLFIRCRCLLMQVAACRVVTALLCAVDWHAAAAVTILVLPISPPPYAPHFAAA